MKLFAAVLELMGSRTPYDNVPVVNMTGMQGRFDFVVVLDRSGGVRSEREGAPPGGGPSTPDDPLADYKRILPNQLGLTLERRRAPVDLLVIDRADKIPTANAPSPITL